MGWKKDGSITITVTVRAGAKCEVVDYSFPSELLVGSYEGFWFELKNAGDTGAQLYIKFVNKSGNPGTIYIKTPYGDVMEVSPGFFGLIATEDKVSPGSTVKISGEVRFDKPGSYEIEVEYGHWG